MEKMQRKRFKVRLGTFFIIIAVFLMVPYLVTIFTTGKIEQVENTALISGRSVVVQYKNASKSLELNKFIAMVLAERFEMCQEIEVLKAEGVMIRTDIYRQMGENMSVQSDMLGMEFMTEKQMKNKWQDKYEENYNLIVDCVASTGNQVIMANNQYIDAKYTEVSCGKTMSGSELLGENYNYMVSVDCSNDIKSEKYLAVETISNKDFAKKIQKIYAQAGVNENNPFESIQIVSKTSDGYVVKLQVGNVIMTGAEFARIFELNSAIFTLEKLQDSIKITTKGVGDGFGVSIYTAGLLAAQGKSYEEILKTFYNGITILSQ